jgi:NAD(P)-dependent dehydrogenase (short-subunit alcohol dehydrogenase family)
MLKINPSALVTGGARRIGRAVALALADEGFDIALHFNTSEQEANATAAEIRAKGRLCSLYQAPLNDTEAARGLVAQVHEDFPGLELLVHSASLFKPSGVGIEALPLLDEHMDIHVRAAWVMGAEFADQVKRGSIIHFLDTRITTNKTDFTAYLLSKKTLAELVKLTALAFAPAVRVNAVAPGFILPPEGKDQKYLDLRTMDIPLRRKGEVSDVTGAVSFLAGNDYITGQVVFVDGGEHLL